MTKQQVFLSERIPAVDRFLAANRILARTRKKRQEGAPLYFSSANASRLSLIPSPLVPNLLYADFITHLGFKKKKKMSTEKSFAKGKEDSRRLPGWLLLLLLQQHSLIVSQLLASQLPLYDVLRAKGIFVHF